MHLYYDYLLLLFIIIIIAITTVGVICYSCKIPANLFLNHDVYKISRIIYIYGPVSGHVYTEAQQNREVELESPDERTYCSNNYKALLALVPHIAHCR